MEGNCRKERPLLEIRREYTGGRLEAKVLAHTFELIVPVIRTKFSTTVSFKAQRVIGWNRSGRLAQGV